MQFESKYIAGQDTEPEDAETKIKSVRIRRIRNAGVKIQEYAQKMRNVDLSNARDVEREISSIEEDLFSSDFGRVVMDKIRGYRERNEVVWRPPYCRYKIPPIEL